MTTPFVALPILIVLVSIGGVSAEWSGETRETTTATTDRYPPFRLSP